MGKTGVLMGTGASCRHCCQSITRTKIYCMLHKKNIPAGSEEIFRKCPYGIPTLDSIE